MIIRHRVEIWWATSPLNLAHRTRRRRAEAFDREQQQRHVMRNFRAHRAGCPCGGPVDYIRPYPIARFRCAEHRAVNAWTRRPGDEHWVPGRDLGERLDEGRSFWQEGDTWSTFPSTRE